MGKKRFHRIRAHRPDWPNLGFYGLKIVIFSFQQNARPGMRATTPGKVPFRCKKHTPPPVAGSRGQGEGVAGWLGGWWLGGWRLVAGLVG